MEPLTCRSCFWIPLPTAGARSQEKWLTPGLGQELHKLSHNIFSKSKEAITVTVQDQTEAALPCQRWENPSSTITDTRLVNDKSLSVKRVHSEAQGSHLTGRMRRSAARPQEELKGKERGIYPAFPMQAGHQGNQVTDTGKFSLWNMTYNEYGRSGQTETSVLCAQGWSNSPGAKPRWWLKPEIKAHKDLWSRQVCRLGLKPLVTTTQGTNSSNSYYKN